MKNRKRLFISLITLSLLLLIALVALSWFLILNRGSLINRILLVGMGIAFLAFVASVGFGIGSLVITLLSTKNIAPLQNFVLVTINLLFPFALAAGRLLGIETSKIRASFIEVNNQLVLAKGPLFSASRVLILAPHCLQRSTCPHKITIDVANCHRCGQCSMDALLGIGEKYGVKVAVATGGTLARKFIKEYKPEAVVAIACERDLTSGIQDSVPLPVLGVLNVRPEGPCFNTQVRISDVENAVKFFLHQLAAQGNPLYNTPVP
ncbi:MAG: DUF116 domain-containing protein [Bacillota bacterium]